MARKKMKWLDAIERVLEESDRPLHSTEIARRAIANDWVETDAQFPEHTVQAAVWRQIKKGDNPRGFVMVGLGRRGSFYWLKRKGKVKP